MEEGPAPAAPIDDHLSAIRNLVWGQQVKNDVFKRWSQGFHFSASERSALEQTQGGPCAVLAPVQAFIIKRLLLDHDGLNFRDTMTEEAQRTVLTRALCEILQQATNTSNYLLVTTRKSTGQIAHDDDDEQQKLQQPEVSGKSMEEEDEEERFHATLTVRLFPEIHQVEEYYKEHYPIVATRYGVILFLYSVIATKGMEQVKAETDTGDPLIDEIYGYGSQSLINLMLTGRAVTYVWDNYQDVGGLKLRGLDKQSQIGFVTLMEHLRYCTVGSFYKNPIHPVWVLGSETHLTVLFSNERRLVSPETKSERARRVFKSYDPDGNNFISSTNLGQVLAGLDLVSDDEYVNIMTKKLDSESLGIILLNAFMDEFFPVEESSAPDMFQVMHYNGLATSNVHNEVKYHFGSAILLESDLKSINESDPMLTCLQTKWPNIEVQWYDNLTPSLN